MNNDKRLQAFEKMLEHIQMQYNYYDSKIEELKIEGKEKTVTFRQLLGKKMLYQDMLSMYKMYDLV